MNFTRKQANRIYAAIKCGDIHTPAKSAGWFYNYVDKETKTGSLSARDKNDNYIIYKLNECVGKLNEDKSLAQNCLNTAWAYEGRY